MNNNHYHEQKQYLNLIIILALSSFLCGSFALLTATDTLILSPFITVMLYIATLFSPPIVAYLMLKKSNNTEYAPVEQQIEILQPSHQWLYHTYSTAKRTI